MRNVFFLEMNFENIISSSVETAQQAGVETTLILPYSKTMDTKDFMEDFDAKGIHEPQED